MKQQILCRKRRANIIKQIKVFQIISDPKFSKIRMHRNLNGISFVIKLL